MNRPPRTLLHGPVLSDFSDLLYFDRLIYPALMVVLQTPETAPGGFPPRETLDEEVRERLMEAGLLVSTGELLLSRGPDQTATGDNAVTGAAQDRIERLVDAMPDICLLRPPFNEANVDAWLQEMDRELFGLAQKIHDNGHPAVPRLYADTVTHTLVPGWDEVLAVQLCLPCLMPDAAPIKTIIAFLCDDQTRQQRGSVFNWYRDMEPGALANGKLTENLTDYLQPRLESYLDYLHASGLVTGSRHMEILLSCGDLLDGCVLPQSNQYFSLACRGLRLPENLDTSLTELASITSVQRNWRDWYQGIVFTT